jgi:succinate dehydrogenase / fumarate reductase cytochrome b subunit
MSQKNSLISVCSVPLWGNYFVAQMNPLISLFTSSIGQKILMALTGLFLITFLLVHCGVNALIFLNDGGEIFNIAANFMGTNWFIRTVEIGLFLFLLMHIVQGLYLWYTNAQKRKLKYGKSAGNANSSWYSRSMGLLGTLLLFFLVIHLKDFWVESRFTDEFEGGQKTLFTEMKAVFANPLAVWIYVLGCISLAYHLLHGFQSAFQSLGLNHVAYNNLIRQTGIGFTVIVCVLFAAMPISMYFGWIQ